MILIFIIFDFIFILACNISRKVKEKIQSFKKGKAATFATEVVFCAHEYNQKYHLVKLSLEYNNNWIENFNFQLVFVAYIFLQNKIDF